MAKKRPIRQGREGAVQQPNKFELLHSRKKFSVLGKKVKGENRSRLQSRSDAIDKVGQCHSAARLFDSISMPCLDPMSFHRYQVLSKIQQHFFNDTSFDLQRKATLLVEHNQRQRANAFLDRRFGGRLSASRILLQSL